MATEITSQYCLRAQLCAFVSYLQQSRQQVDPLCVQPDGGKDKKKKICLYYDYSQKNDTLMTKISKCRGGEYSSCVFSCSFNKCVISSWKHKVSQEQEIYNKYGDENTT